MRGDGFRLQKQLQLNFTKKFVEFLAQRFFFQDRSYFYLQNNLYHFFSLLSLLVKTLPSVSSNNHVSRCRNVEAKIKNKIKCFTFFSCQLSVKMYKHPFYIYSMGLSLFLLPVMSTFTIDSTTFSFLAHKIIS